jgi:transcription initiation factor TFIIIB Brf1 subunit/transcription initiation factor TFIIB
VVFMACRIERSARLVSDLVVADPNVTESQVNKYFWKLNRILQSDVVGGQSLVRDQQTAQGPESFLARFGSRLDLVRCELTAEHVAIQIAATNMLGARNPAVIAAACLYTVALLLDLENKPTLERVAEVTQLKVHTLRNCYLTLKQHIHRFLPTNFEIKLAGGVNALPL